jgi:galactokinase
LPDEQVFVIATSGVVAAKTGSALAAYNHAAALAAEALDAWRAATGSEASTLAAALSDVPNVVDEFRGALKGRADLIARVEHLDVESRIVRAASDALARGDLDRLGRLVDESQVTAERLLGNQVQETIGLARTARELGAIASSAFGAGFGGSVYALVLASQAETFRRQWMERYIAAFPNRSAMATFFISRAGPPATALTSLGT